LIKRAKRVSLAEAEGRGNTKRVWLNARSAFDWPKAESVAYMAAKIAEYFRSEPISTTLETDFTSEQVERVQNHRQQGG